MGVSCQLSTTTHDRLSLRAKHKAIKSWNITSTLLCTQTIDFFFFHIALVYWAERACCDARKRCAFEMSQFAIVLFARKNALFARSQAFMNRSWNSRWKSSSESIELRISLGQLTIGVTTGKRANDSWYLQMYLVHCHDVCENQNKNSLFIKLEKNFCIRRPSIPCFNFDFIRNSLVIVLKEWC